MTPQDVYEQYGSGYKFWKATGMSASSLHNWFEQGFVPEASQYKLERLTKGALKVDMESIDKMDKKAKSKFVVGDKCHTWSLTWTFTPFGNTTTGDTCSLIISPHIPLFSEYKITEIIHRDSCSFACLSHEEQVSMAMPLHLIFKTRREAINGLIKLLEDLKKDDKNAQN